MLLPCPRLQRRQEQDSDLDDGPSSPSTANSHQDVQDLQHPLSVEAHDDDRRELGDLFHPSTPPPRDKHRNHHIPQLRRVFSRAPETPFPVMTPRRSRVSLVSLSSKLRKRFSRDINLLRKNSRRTITHSHDSDGSQAGGGEITQCGEETYDSDAHCLSTPQITQRLDGSPFGRPRAQCRLSILSSETVPNTPSEVPAVSRGERERESVGDNTESHTDVNATLDTAAEHSEPENGPPQQPIIEAQEEHDASADQESSGIRDGVDRNLCCTPAESSLDDSAFYTPREGHSLLEHDEDSMIKGGCGDGQDSHEIGLFQTENRSDSTVVGDGVETGLPETNDCGETTPEPSPHGLQAIPEISLSPSGLRFFTGPSSRVTSGYRSVSVYSDLPPLPAGAHSSAISDSCSALSGTDTVDGHETGPQDEQERSIDLFTPKTGNSQLRPPFSVRPQGTMPGGELQVAKRSVTAPVGSRFVENFEESPALRNRRENRVSSEGWLTGGRRLGYGYAFVDGPKEAVPPEPLAPVVNEPANNEQQDTERPQAEEAPKTAVSVTESDHIEPDPSEELQIPVRKRSILVQAWARLPVSGKKDASPLRALLGRNAAQTTPDGATSASPSASADLRKKPSKTERLFRPWSRLSRNNSVAPENQEPAMEVDTPECTANVELVDATDQPGEPTAEAIPETDSQTNPEDDLRIDATTRESVPRRQAIHRGPGGYDGPVDESSMGGDGADTPDENDVPSLTAITSAEEWSRMYKDVLPHLSMSEETLPSVILGVTSAVEEEAGGSNIIKPDREES